MDLSLVASIFETLQIAPPSKLTLLDADTLRSAHVPPFPPDIDALLTGIDSNELAAQVQTVLLAVYPGEHVLRVVKDGRSSDVKLMDFEHFSTNTSVFVGSLGEGTSFESFAEIVAHLRAPDGCPWDREQTHQSLRTHLLEEAYEALSAMDANDPGAMREEFGDLLLQIVLNAQIAYQAGEFTVTQVIKNINEKLIRRHPHVFGEVRVDGVNGVLQNWEKLKEKERGARKEEKGILDGVPAALPALSQAQEYQDRAARVGFDWPSMDGVLDKILEEVNEIKHAETDFELASEVGDLFFVLVNLARWKHVDAESVLRATNMKFRKRFAYVEQGAKKQGRNLSEMTLEEMDELWNEAKKAGL